MLTFQILDGGETFYRPLDDRPVTIGSGEDADIRLSGDNVSPLHARVTVANESGYTIEAVDGCELAINNERMARAELDLGDRVEIGDSVLVVGKQVKRPATASDVLVGGGRRRMPWEGQKRSKTIKRMYALVGVLGVLACFAVYKWGFGVENTHLPLVDQEQVRLARRTGRFEDARTILDRLDHEWVGEDAGRRKLVADHRRRIEATAKAFSALHEQYMADVLNTSKLKQLQALRVLPESATIAEREAARILASNLTEYRIAAEKKLRAAGGPMGVPTELGGGDVRLVEGKGEPAERPGWLDERLAEIRALSAKGEHVRAYETARFVLPDVPSEFAGPLLDVLAEVRTATRVEADKLVAQAYALRDNKQLAAGVKLLRDASMRFPTEGELSKLYRVLGVLSAEIGVSMPERNDVVVRPVNRQIAKDPVAHRPQDPKGHEAAPASSSGAVASMPVDKSMARGTLEAVERATGKGDLNGAVALLDKAIERHQEYQPGLANFLRDEAANLKLIQDLVFAFIGDESAVKGRNIKIEGGERGNVEMIDATSVHLRIGGKVRVVPWLSLTVDGASTLATAVQAEPATRLGVAALGYVRGDVEAAEGYLAKLVTSNRALFPAVTKVVSRGRGEVLDADGYAIVNGEFVAKRFLKVEKTAARFARKLSRIGEQSAAEREKILAALREEPGEDVDDAIVLAMKNEMAGLAKRLQKNRLPKQLRGLAAKRVELDKRRQHALDLIYDARTYFYPYKPPAVSGAKYAEYVKVQQDVDRRVAAVREIWNDKKTKVAINAKVKRDIAALLWFEKELANMGEVNERALSQVEWVRAIPAVKDLSIRTYCKSAQERERFEHWMKIRRFNDAVMKSENVSHAVTLQVHVTNAYRLMFNHRPLAVSPKLYKAAQGHADEMIELGYFSHTSPTPKHRTPYMRMRAQGYSYGISENIAGNPSAEGAHNAWCHSSGHHRNLLNAGHTEFGVGNTGHRWVQNFGRGKGYVDDKRFPK